MNLKWRVLREQISARGCYEAENMRSFELNNWAGSEDLALSSLIGRWSSCLKCRGGAVAWETAEAT
jgi:hypothetical protein